jgi:hypothetical protein
MSTTNMSATKRVGLKHVGLKHVGLKHVGLKHVVHKHVVQNGNLIQVLDLGTAITIETEMSESTTAKEIGTGEQMTAVDKVPTTAHKDRGDAEYQLGEQQVRR